MKLSCPVGTSVCALGVTGVSVTTTYVYDAAGQLAAEYGTPPSSPCATCYLTDDHLGSTRAVTDGGALVQSLHDYLPFGEEIRAGVGVRVAPYYPPSETAVNDGVTQKFTGKERDVETGLDYFGARYLSSAQGRWTSPDWSAAPEPVPYANLDDPQTLNLYAYVRNAPLSTRDADGHCGGGGGDPPCSQVQVSSRREEKPKIKVVSEGDKKVVYAEGKLQDTVTVKGTVKPGLRVSESNQQTTTIDGKQTQPVLKQGTAETNKKGQFADNIGYGYPTSGTKAENKAIKAQLSTEKVQIVDVQTLTLTLPKGESCSWTSTRTLTNVDANGNASGHYDLSTTQPVRSDK